MTRAEAIRSYEFGGFRLDPSRRLLFGRDGEAIALKPKVFDTLLHFVEHAGQLVNKEELMRAVWGDVVVEENSLNQHVSALRHVFDETPGENRFIVTIPGRGYRFVATVRGLAPGPGESDGACNGGPRAGEWWPQQALELARNGAPKEPFYLTGQAGGKTFSIHAQGERVFLTRAGEPRQEIDESGPVSHRHARILIGSCAAQLKSSSG